MSAAEYLLQAEDWPALVALVKAEGGRYFEQGEATRMLRWMAEVPPEVLAADPAAVLATVGLHPMCGSSLAGEALLDRFESVAEFDEAGAASARPGRRGSPTTRRRTEPKRRPNGRWRSSTAASPFRTARCWGSSPRRRPARARRCRWRSPGRRAAQTSRRLRLGEVDRVRPASPSLDRARPAEPRRGSTRATAHLRSALDRRVPALLPWPKTPGWSGTRRLRSAHLALARVRLEQGRRDLAESISASGGTGPHQQAPQLLALEFAERAHVALAPAGRPMGWTSSSSPVADRAGLLLPVVEGRLARDREARLHLLAGRPASGPGRDRRRRRAADADVLGAQAAIAAAVGDTVTPARSWTLACARRG